jgi:hypothetical protein
VTHAYEFLTAVDPYRKEGLAGRVKLGLFDSSASLPERHGELLALLDSPDKTFSRASDDASQPSFWDVLNPRQEHDAPDTRGPEPPAQRPKRGRAAATAQQAVDEAGGADAPRGADASGDADAHASGGRGDSVNTGAPPESGPDQQSNIGADGAALPSAAETAAGSPPGSRKIPPSSKGATGAGAAEAASTPSARGRARNEPELVARGVSLFSASC